jgi:hypothetical protein
MWSIAVRALLRYLSQKVFVREVSPLQLDAKDAI